MTLEIRMATADDAAACREIYAPSVLASSTSFEVAVPAVSEMAARIELALKKHQWLIAHDAASQVVGYAYAGAFRNRAAYRFGAETSVYTAPAEHRRGVGRRLYEVLLAGLREQGYFQAYAGITLPNAASVAFHERLGFTAVGRFPRAGFKFGRWHDVGWWHRALRDDAPEAG